MASLSPLSINRTCFYCKTVSAILRPGWRLRNGGSAMLCNRCAAAYEEGRFCNIFHADASGWRDCVTCKKNVHCGCIMSTHTHNVLDFGGVRCTECIATDILMGANGCRFLLNSAPYRTGMNPPEVRLSVSFDKVITGITSVAPSKKDAPLPKGGEQPCAGSPKKAGTPCDNPTCKKKAHRIAPRKYHSYRRYSPEASDEELQQIQRDSNAVVVPLFEKELTISDADPKNGRLVIPKKCAKDYFPSISEPQGFPIKIQDTSGNEWDFHFRFWPNNNSTMYVLEGIRDFLTSNQCQAGDRVTFYRVNPEGKLVIGLRKASASASFQKKQQQSHGQYANLRKSGRSK